MFDAIKKMAEKRVGALLVRGSGSCFCCIPIPSFSKEIEGRIEGILTERDYLSKVNVLLVFVALIMRSCRSL